MMTGAATVLKMIQKATTATPMVFCKSGSVEVGSLYSKLVGHEIEDALGDERGAPNPAARAKRRRDSGDSVPGVFQRRNRHETDEQRRKRVAEIQDDGLEDVSPKQHQRSELPDEPEQGGDDEVGGGCGVAT